MTDTEAFIDFVMQYASDKFTRDSVQRFLSTPESSVVLRRWKQLFDGGQQNVILKEIGCWEDNPEGWSDYGDLAETEREYNGQLTLLKADLIAYQNELAALTSSPNANNTPLSIQAIQDNIARTQKGINDTADKLQQIEVWKAAHPNTVSTS